MTRASYGISGAFVIVACVWLLAALTLGERPRDVRVVSTVEQGQGGAFDLHRARFALSNVALHVEDVHMGRDVDGVRRRRGALAVFNGGFFDPRGENEGVLVHGRRVVTPWSRAIGGGVLVIAGARGRLLDGEVDPGEQATRADFAIQCRPRLVVGGAVNVRSDDGRLADRTALCLREEGRVLEVVVARGHGGERTGPTLRELAMLLAASGCEDALNLDGGPSTGAAFGNAGGPLVLPPRADVRMMVTIARRRIR